ncbi:DUF3073 domain-containing protein [Pseudonocardia sp.]|uniref:DUF3073 domain-containing protein n=1 Tax=Pseudonocardia sp. TaxID=60912 RepID=UPI003D0F64A9
MGRGRAKAKQTKVARELKYSSPAMDIAALQRELGGGLGGGSAAHNGRPVVEDVEEYDDDPYAAEYDDEDDEQPASRAR